MEKRFNDFMDNHWPHLRDRVARIEGSMYIMGLMLVAILALVGVLVAKG